ncbi:MAG: hypothetical protein LBF19_02105, partial [Prevotellaceae bacterium]|nr:hypothetical protein [Prevotellaceae bacterium]
MLDCFGLRPRNDALPRRGMMSVERTANTVALRVPEARYVSRHGGVAPASVFYRHTVPAGTLRVFILFVVHCSL